jgi:hypothetical protein
VPPERPGDVTAIDTSLDQCWNRHEVLRSQHVPLLADGPIGGGTFSLVVGGTSYFGVLRTSITGADSLPMSRRSPPSGTSLDRRTAARPQRECHEPGERPHIIETLTGPALAAQHRRRGCVPPTPRGTARGGFMLTTESREPSSVKAHG